MFLLVLAFILVPLAELYVIIQVGSAIGVLPTIAILLADSLLGSFLMRSQGRAAWQRFRTASAGGQLPAREAVDGGLVIFGGALLLTPGFLTDVLGLALLVPASRAVVRRLLAVSLLRRLGIGAVIPVAAHRHASSRPPGGRAGPGGDWVDGTAHEVGDPPRLP